MTVVDAMRRALVLAAERPVRGPNPRVGCVLLASGNEHDPRMVLAEGRNHGVGTPHAEAEALADAQARGVDVRGSTAVVTLEPCHHRGRTPPCSSALLDAGVSEVVYAVADPHAVAAGGGAWLADHGVRVTEGLLADEGTQVLGVWLDAVRAGRPFVTLKIATSLDGRVAAADGSSRWITGDQARMHAHEVRAQADAILVGTGTVRADDPSLTARGPEGRLADTQPLRVVVGHSPVPASARVRSADGGELVVVRSRDVREVLSVLQEREVRHVVVEGGPVVASAFLAAGAVDEVHAYVAPVLLGSGRSAVVDIGVRTIGEAVRLSTVGVRQLGEDMLVVARPVGPSREEEC